MVSRRLRSWLLALLGFGLLTVAAVAWLGWSSSGARWAVATCSRLLPGTLTLETVEGRLADRLSLTGIHYQTPGIQLQASRLELRWQPLGLLRGELWVARLAANDLSLTTPAAATPQAGAGEGNLSGIAWPQVSGWPLRLRARLDQLQLTKLQLRSGEETIFELQSLTGNLSWRSGTLRARSLELVNADGRLHGDLEINLASQSAEVQLTFAPTPGGQLEAVPAGHVQLKLRGGGASPLSGELQAAAAWGAEPALELATDFELVKKELRLSGLQLTRQGLAGKGVGAGRLTAGAAGPVLAVDLQLSDVDLRPETLFPTAISGTLAGQVDSSGYAGRFNLNNRGGGWQEMAVQGRFAGDTEGIGLKDLHARWLGGGVQGELRIDWSGVPFLAADLEGSALDPAPLAAAWPGAINLRLHGRMDFPAELPWVARWQARIGPSRLRGLDLQGRIDGRYDGATLELERLQLDGPGLFLTARGELARRLEVSLRIDDLSRLDDAARGTGEAQGWLRWQSQTGWAASGRGRARNLAYGPWQLKSLDAKGAWLPVKNRLALSLTAEDLTRGAWGAKHLQVTGEGRIDDHRLALTARWGEGRAELELAGGWHDGAWQGQLGAMAAADSRYGHWRLRQPVTLDLGEKRLAWSSLVLQGEKGERLTGRGELELAPLDGQLELAVHQFSLGWLSPWLATAELTGEAEGAATLLWSGGRLARMEGNLAGQGIWSRAGRELMVEHLDSRFDWSSAGLDGQWEVDLGTHGRCEGTVRSHRTPELALPKRGKVDAHWQNLDLALLNPWLEGMALAGRSTGTVMLNWQEDRSLTLRLAADGQPELTQGDMHLALAKAHLEVDWDTTGLRGQVALADHADGRLDLTLQSGEPAHLGWPTKGNLAWAGEGIDLALLRPLLPAGVKLEGRLALQGEGGWRPGARWTASGQVAISGGHCAFRRGNREFYAELQTARLAWQWAGEALETDLTLELGARGAVQGRLRLPLPARFPVVLDKQGALQGTLDGRFREDGLLGSLFPGMIQESKGELRLELAVAGSWAAPRLTGKGQLSGAGAYLPAVGIRLRDVKMSVQLTEDRLLLEDLEVTSGNGVLHGSGELALHDLTPGACRFELKGDGVQAIDLPELQLTVSPDLVIAGIGKQLETSGTLVVPKALFRGRQGKAPVTSSTDLVIVDAPVVEENPLILAMSFKVTVRLGDQVLVKTEGLDARLRGEVLVQGKNRRVLRGQGKIEVVKGEYAAYGVRLAITHGIATFSGGPVEEPALDVLALRELEEIKAGVRVTGTPSEPEVRLYSDPSMPDTDILAYMVLGHPLGGDNSQVSLMMAAAGALLSQGDSAVIQDRLKNQLGLDVIDVRAGKQEAIGGQTGKSNVIAGQTSKGGTSGSLVTIGKYLSPSLYLSFGQSVFTNTSQVGLRYQIDRHWQLESSMGTESGADLYYRITFE